jgi:hypothetical protein
MCNQELPGASAPAMPSGVVPAPARRDDPGRSPLPISYFIEYSLSEIDLHRDGSFDPRERGATAKLGYSG